MTQPDPPQPTAPGATPAAAPPARRPIHPEGLSLSRHAWLALKALVVAEPGEPLPVLGGRMLIGVALLVGIAAVSPRAWNAWIDRRLHPLPARQAAVWEVGKEAEVQLTVITADARRLNCAHDQVLEGQHCGYTAAKRSWPRPPGALLDDNDALVIQPYRTADTNALILVSGLWAQPELALRLHREPPTYYDVKKQLRFVAYCKVRFIGELSDVALRWETGGKWFTEPKAQVAQALTCTLDPPNG